MTSSLNQARPCSASERPLSRKVEGGKLQKPLHTAEHALKIAAF